MKRIIAIIGIAAMLLAFKPTLNWTSWLGDVPKPQFLVQKTTPEGIDAGRRYLKAVLSNDSEAFYTELKSINRVAVWNFIGDDPSLYLHNGLLYNTDPKYKTMWSLPSGNFKNHVANLLMLAERDAANQKTAQASERIQTLIELGDHLSRFPQVVSVLLGASAIDCATTFLKRHPECITPELKYAIANTVNLEANMKVALKDEGPSPWRVTQLVVPAMWKLRHSRAEIEEKQASWRNFIDSKGSREEMAQKAGKQWAQKASWGVETLVERMKASDSKIRKAIDIS